MYNLVVWFSGFLFSVVLGHIGVKWLNCVLRKYIKVKEKPARLTPALGCIERSIYTLATSFPGHYYVIVTLFSIKMAERFITFTKITEEEHIEKASEHANVFMICNIVSLCFGILGGRIIRYFIVK